jgi:hypothetical protein
MIQEGRISSIEEIFTEGQKIKEPQIIDALLPDLRKLETKYSQELVVIGVHSAKFQNEKDTSQIRDAILRYEIHHPVVNDSSFEIWQSYGASGWPTVVLINPEARSLSAAPEKACLSRSTQCCARPSLTLRPRGVGARCLRHID